MARPTGQPPSDLLRQARDVAPRVGEEPELAATQPIYVNDIQPTVETDGSITLTCAYFNGRFGTSESVAINMPAGRLMELIQIAPQLAAGAAMRSLKHGNQMRAIAEASGQEVQVEEYVPPARAGVTDLGGGRRG